MPEPRRPETILAFDFGLRRIGAAVGQTVTASASPLGIVRNHADGPDHARIRTLVREWRPNLLVVGMPSHADGSPGDLAEPIRGFIAELKAYDLPIDTVDERYTSREAQAALQRARQTGAHRRIKKEHIDAAAAVLIAERYLARI